MQILFVDYSARLFHLNSSKMKSDHYRMWLTHDQYSNYNEFASIKSIKKKRKK